MDTVNNLKSGNKNRLWIVGGCLAILVCIAGATLLVFGGIYKLGFQTPDNVTVQLDVPTEARIGDSFKFSINVNNMSTETVELVGVDFSMNFLDGIIIESTDPSYSNTEKYEVLGGGETFITYYFRRSIAPGESLTLLFNAKAITEGDFNGNVDVCINSDFNCLPNVTRIVIGK